MSRDVIVKQKYSFKKQRESIKRLSKPSLPRSRADDEDTVFAIADAKPSDSPPANVKSNQKLKKSTKTEEKPAKETKEQQNYSDAIKERLEKLAQVIEKNTKALQEIKERQDVTSAYKEEVKHTPKEDRTGQQHIDINLSISEIE